MAQTLSDQSLLHMSLDGVAAYWLSLRKLLGGARSLKALESEADYASEPFVRHLLSLLFSGLSPEQRRHIAEIGAQSELDRLDRQFDLMRIAIMDIATGENPLRTLARVTACFPVPLPSPELLLETAQTNLALVLDNCPLPESCQINHRINDEALVMALLFYAIMARRHGKAATRAFLPQTGSVFFTDALALVVDGFDAPFVRKWMKKFKQSILNDMRRKMTLSIDLCFAIQDRVPFEDMRFLVRSYIR